MKLEELYDETLDYNKKGTQINDDQGTFRDNLHKALTRDDYRRNNFVDRNAQDDKSDNSFEEKVKKLQKIKDDSKAQSLISPHTNSTKNLLSKNYSTHVSNVTDSSRVRSKSKTLSKVSNQRKLLVPNKSSTIVNEKEIQSKNINELKQLKKEIQRLKLENEKLKTSLASERSKNSKFQEFAEDLLKFYE